MRARYSAFAVRDESYLFRTWHPRTRPDSMALPAGRGWTRLVSCAPRTADPRTTRGSWSSRLTSSLAGALASSTR